MRTQSKLSVFTLADGSTITTRSALETRWAIFFSELRLHWQYEPHRISSYLPDFKVEGLGYVEIKPTLDLLISETSNKIRDAVRHTTNEKIFAFIGEKVSFDTVALYQGNRIFQPTHKHMVDIFLHTGDVSTQWPFDTVVEVGLNRANRAKLDHFVSVGKVLELETIPAQRNIVREASERFKQQQNR